MNQEEFDFLQGQIQAITMTIGQMIAVMPELPAAQAAVGLAVAQEEQNMSDTTDGTPDRAIRSRNSILGAYVTLLQTVSSNG